LFNSHVWMVEFWDLPYVGQDTNVTIENTIQHWKSRKSQERTEWWVVVKQSQKKIYNREDKHKHTIMLNT
jgi:hypothetical protein